MTRVILVLLLFLFQISCIVTRSEGDRIHADINQLRSELLQVQKAQRELEHKMTERLKQAEKIGATTGQDFERVMNELQTLRGQLEEAQHKLQETDGSTSTPPLPSKSKPTADVPANKPEHFEYARTLMQQKKYDSVLPVLDAFVERYAEDPLTEKVYFWRGESLYALAKSASGEARKDLNKKAILSYQQLLTKFPRSALYSAALFQVGDALESMGFVKDARVFYEEILEKYAKSEQANQAKKRLAVLKGKK